MTTLINLTKHPIKILDGQDRVVVVVAPAPQPVRALLPVERVRWAVLASGQAIPILQARKPIARHLPLPQPDVLYIVPRMITEAFPHRDDLVTPENIVRDQHDRIIGCRALARCFGPFSTRE